MARLPRLYLPGLPQLAQLNGHDGDVVFRDAADYQAFLDALREAARANGFALHAYVLLPDRLFLLGTGAGPDSLARTLQSVGRRYVTSFNLRHGRSGTLWNGRFRSTVVAPDEFLLPAMRFIETHPLRARLVGDAADWPWSSLRHHLGIAADPGITDRAEYWALGNTPFERQAGYRAYAEDSAGAEAEHGRIGDSVRGGWLLASPEFAANVGRSTDRRLSPARPGRPRKLDD